MSDTHSESTHDDDTILEHNGAANGAPNDKDSEHHKHQFPMVKVSGPWDPERCECSMTNVSAGGEIACPWKRIPESAPGKGDGSKRCPIHDRGVTARRRRAAGSFNYRLNTWKQRHEGVLSASEAAVTLREEVGIIRLLIDEHIDLSTKQGSADELFQHSSAVLYLIKLMGQLSENCATLEIGLEHLMSKNNAYSIATKVMETVIQTTKGTSDEASGTKARDEIAAIVQRLASPPTPPSAKIYRVPRWQAKVDEFVTGERVVCLRNEIGVLRIYVEECLNSCKDTQDIVIKAAQIADYVKQISLLVTQAHRLEKLANLLLDEAAVAAFTNGIIGVITANIKEPATLDSIHDRLEKIL